MLAGTSGKKKNSGYSNHIYILSNAVQNYNFFFQFTFNCSLLSCVQFFNNQTIACLLKNNQMWSAQKLLTDRVQSFHFMISHLFYMAKQGKQCIRL